MLRHLKRRKVAMDGEVTAPEVHEVDGTSWKRMLPQRKDGG
jgi:putative heme degradation protein